ncbi:MBL fold metallo-hydrolase [Lewinella sp. W8]|uniref:MBL fold metallo-hydrolase n=1 Tax=Lewinella sp. W8 TaxID=2528208 RepID=UPI001068C7A6|nr:MBL fold metallo-hydrolase [Lewinella sp. W8]MTB49746.1 MBL fold metallo-hydrolase [Lewinella sp. W8]
MTSEPTLTIVGTATSQGVPVLGCDCPVCTSGDPRDQRLRASVLLRNGTETLAVDAGPDFRTQLLRERVHSLAGLILTHEHNDHTAGLDDVRPYCFRQKIDMPVYCLPRVAEELRSRFAYAFSDYPGVPRLDIREVGFGEEINFNGRAVTLLEVLHGKLPILGLRIGDLAYLTDAKTLPERTLRQLRGVKTVIISALHHQGTHSHLSLEEALEYVERIGAERGVITHLSHRMGTAAAVEAMLPDKVRCGFDGMRIIIGRS